MDPDFFYPMLILAEKLSCFFIGFFIIRMGYKLIASGIKGEFKFSANYKGVKGGLISSSPGLLFVLLGTTLIGYALFIEKSYTFNHKQAKSLTILPAKNSLHDSMQVEKVELMMPPIKNSMKLKSKTIKAQSDSITSGDVKFVLHNLYRHMIKDTGEIIKDTGGVSLK